MNETKKQKFSVPNNFAIEWQLFEGIGKNELKILVITTLIGITIAIISALIFKTGFMTGFVIVVITDAITVACVQKLENGISLIDYYRMLLKYRRSQQTFLYEYMEEK